MEEHDHLLDVIWRKLLLIGGKDVHRFWSVELVEEYQLTVIGWDV